MWHVYIDESFRRDLVLYIGASELPFADCFNKMKLFRTKEAAKRYMRGELRKISKSLFLGHRKEGCYIESVDGGEIQDGFVVYGGRNGDKIVKAIRIKAVFRTVE